jgi:hypothetical protein
MKSSAETRRKPAPRAGKAQPQVLSTSEARANFAEALETAHVDNAVIGFDRYGRTVAALVPVEAIYMLAGMGHLVKPATRKEIEDGSRLFARNVPYKSFGAEPAAAPAKAAKKSTAKTIAKKQATTIRKRR